MQTTSSYLDSLADCALEAGTLQPGNGDDPLVVRLVGRPQRARSAALAVAVSAILLSQPAAGAPGDIDTSFGVGGRADPGSLAPRGLGPRGAGRPVGGLCRRRRIIARTTAPAPSPGLPPGCRKPVRATHRLRRHISAAPRCTTLRRRRIRKSSVSGHDWARGAVRAAIVFRMLANGSLDVDFAGGGVLALANPGSEWQEVSSVLVDDQQRIVIAGSRDGNLMLVRLLPDGTLDMTFGTNGVFIGPASYGLGIVASRRRRGRRLPGAAGRQQLRRAGRYRERHHRCLVWHGGRREPGFVGCTVSVHRAAGGWQGGGRRHHGGQRARGVAAARQRRARRNVQRQRRSDRAHRPDGARHRRQRQDPGGGPRRGRRVARGGDPVAGQRCARRRLRQGRRRAGRNGVPTTAAFRSSTTSRCSRAVACCWPAAATTNDNVVPLVTRLLADGEAGPGVITVSGRNFEVTDAQSGQVVVHVRRIGGSKGAVSVAVNTSEPDFDDTPASAPSDYTAVAQRLNWADGDTTEKQVVVPIVAGSTPLEGDEALGVELSDPQGGAGLGLRKARIVVKGDGSPSGFFSCIREFRVGEGVRPDDEGLHQSAQLRRGRCVGHRRCGRCHRDGRQRF